MFRFSYTVLMRANSLSFKLMASLWAVSFGVISLAMALIESFVLAPCRFPKTEATLLSISPDASRASIVFLKVGGSGLLIIALISACCCFIPSS